MVYQVCDNGTPVLCDTALVVINVTPVNDPPVAVRDNGTTPEETPVTIGVTGNDTDPDGTIDPTTVTITDQPNHGTVTVNPTTGVITYTPANGFNGTDTLVYQVCDNGTPVLCDTALVVITVGPVNDPPVAVRDNATTPEGTLVNINIPTNDSDSDGVIDFTTVTITDQPNHGTVTVNPNGTIDYTPSPGFNGVDTLVYNICDNGTPVLCDTALVVITVQPAVQITGVVTNVSCFGGSNGAIDLIILAGTPPFTVVWAHGPTTEDVSGLAAGTYSATITDANGLSTVGTWVISEPTLLTASSTITTAILCNSGQASIQISGNGGTAPYTGTGTFNQSAGTQTYNVTDSLGCTASVPVTVIEPALLVASSTVATAVACNGGQAAVTVSATGGTAPFTGTGTFNQAAGTQVYTVTDGNGCTATVSETVTEPAAALVASSTVTTTVVCNGGQAVVTVSAIGGTAPYTGTGTLNQAAGTQVYTVTDANGCSTTASQTVTEPVIVTVSVNVTTAISCNGGQATVQISGVGGTAPYTGEGTFNQAAGTQNYTVTDANGCSATQPVTIVQPNTLIASSVISTAISCNGGQATVTVSANGGTAPFIGEGNFSQAAGTQTYTVTDANGCISTVPVTVTQPDTFVASSTVTTAIACNGGQATITVSATGGTAPYTGAGTFSQNAGTQVYTVTDANGCTAATTVTVTQPANALTLTTSIFEAFCFTNTGSATVNVTGGTGPYTYLWNNGDTAQTLDSVPTGNYSVVVTDFNGCTATADTVNVPRANCPPVALSPGTGMCVDGVLHITLTATDIDGTVDFTQTVIGSNPTHGTVVNNADGTVDYTPTTGFEGTDSFTYTVEDNEGAVSNLDTFVITVTPPPTVTITPSGPINFCANNGSSVTLVANSGASSYLWSTGATTQSITVTTAGIYCVTITNATGCTNQTCIEVTTYTPTPPIVTTSGNTIFCEGDSVLLTSSIATEYLWSNGATTQSIYATEAGEYSVDITDSLGCSASSTPLSVITKQHPTVNAGPDITICQPGSTVTLVATTGDLVNDIAWSNGVNTASNSVFVGTTQAFIVTASNDFCPAVTDTVNVIVVGGPTAAFTVTGNSLGNPTNFTDISEGNIVSWSYNFGDGTSSSSPNVFHTYETADTFNIVLTVTNANGCEDTAMHTLGVTADDDFPNSITPNGDGSNDLIWIKNNGVKSYEFTVYNRWGQQVYISEGREVRWEGRTNAGVILEEGTYFVVLKSKRPTGDKEDHWYITLFH